MDDDEVLKISNNMIRNNVFKNIEDRYNQSIIAPENPFTVDNPDALVYNGHTLMGLFIPLAKELKNPDMLLRRLYLSRLSLCKTVSHVLFLSGEEELVLANNEQINAAFDAVLVNENMDGLLRFLSDNIRAKHFIDPRLKKDRMRRFWGTIDFISKYGLANAEYGEMGDLAEYEVQSWSNPDRGRYSRNAGYNHPILMAKKRATKEAFIGGYEGLMTYTTMFNYTLHSGILKGNPLATDTFQFLNVEDLENVTKNTMNVRTLVFLGYLPGRINGNYDIMGLRDRYFTFMEQNKYL